MPLLLQSFARAALLAVPYFFGVLLVQTTSESVVPEPHERRLKTLPLVQTEIPDSGQSHGESLIQKSLLQKSKKGKLETKNPLPAGWFGDFSQAESTYTTEGLDADQSNPAWSVKYGRDPSLEPQFSPTKEHAFTPAWFHESPSGGYVEAWQTHYPAIQSNIAGNAEAAENKWRETPMGWRQDYTPMMEDEQEAGKFHAQWFDNSVVQLDGFGRKLTPSLGDGQRYNSDKMSMWKERSVNTTLRCKEPGCTALAQLNLFNNKEEDARLCSLSVAIHPTDYDDDWSEEHVEFLKVNDYHVTRECNPRARGCNKTADLPLYPCVNNYNVDKLVDSAGSLKIEAKNTLMVDECPHKDEKGEENLLSGIAMVTCMVRKKPLVAPPAPAPPPGNLIQKCEDVVKCNTHGCTGTAHVACSPALALNGGTCKMNISVRQTDYDDKLGLPEQIDFFQVVGTNMTKDGKVEMQPGKNPCNAEYKDNPLPEDELWFNAVSDHDITELMKKSAHLGQVEVIGKISHQVDECGYEDNLLYGKVTILCKPPEGMNFAALPPGGLTEIPQMLEADKDRIKKSLRAGEKGLRRADANENMLDPTKNGPKNIADTTDPAEKSDVVRHQPSIWTATITSPSLLQKAPVLLQKSFQPHLRVRGIDKSN